MKDREQTSATNNRDNLFQPVDVNLAKASQHNISSIQGPHPGTPAPNTWTNFSYPDHEKDSPTQKDRRSTEALRQTARTYFMTTRTYDFKR